MFAAKVERYERQAQVTQSRISVRRVTCEASCELTGLQRTALASAVARERESSEFWPCPCSLFYLHPRKPNGRKKPRQIALLAKVRRIGRCSLVVEQGADRMGKPNQNSRLRTAARHGSVLTMPARNGKTARRARLPSRASRSARHRRASHRDVCRSIFCLVSARSTDRGELATPHGSLPLRTRRRTSEARDVIELLARRVNALLRASRELDRLLRLFAPEPPLAVLVRVSSFIFVLHQIAPSSKKQFTALTSATAALKSLKAPPFLFLSTVISYLPATENVCVLRNRATRSR